MTSKKNSPATHEETRQSKAGGEAVKGESVAWEEERCGMEAEDAEKPLDSHYLRAGAPTKYQFVGAREGKER